MTDETQAAEVEVTTPDGATETQAQATSEPTWLDALGDEKGYVETKGWKDPADLLKSYKSLESLRGVPEDRLLKLPEDTSADGALDPIYDKLGRPESADKYTNEVGEALTDDVYKTAAEKAHKLGLTDGQFAGMQSWMKETMGGLEQQRQQELDGAFNDWSAENPKALASAKRFAAAMEVDEATMDKALSGDKVALFDLLGKAGARIGEKPSIDGEANPEMGMSPAAAKTKIEQLMGDKSFTDQYFSDNPKMRKPAMQRMETLQKVAAGGSQ